MEFGKLIEDGITCVDFWAPWCGPCVAFAPKFEEAAQMMEKENATSDENKATLIKFQKINVDEHGELATRYGIKSIPTIVLFKNGDVIGRTVGGFPSAVALIDWIKEQI